MVDPLSQTDRSLVVTTPAGDDVLLAVSLTGREAMSQPFELTLDLVSESQSIEIDKVLGSAVTAQVTLDDTYSRYFNGIVWQFTAGAVSEVADAPIRHYQARLVPWTFFLQLNSNCRIFQEMTAPEIIEQIFKDGGYLDYSLSLKATYTKLEYCVQYNETDYDFIHRLMQQYGIFYYFTHTEEKHTLVMGDAAASYADCDESSVEFFDSFDDHVTGQLKSWSHRYQCTTGNFALSDYDYTNPTTDLAATEKTVVKNSNTSSLARYHYPGGYLQTADGKTLATTRMEAQEANYDQADGASYHPGFFAGAKFTITEHPAAEEVNAKYVLSTVEHHVSEPILFASGNSIGKRGADQPLYWNQFSCLPSKTPLRPEQTVPKPVIHGPQSAVVVGAKDQEIYTDKFGCVKVQFHWDREGKMDENSSCWMRVAQSWASGKFGFQFLPRVGNEVIVEYLNGDIDRPIITGSVFNGDNMPLYAQPDENYMSGIKTLSTDKAEAKNYNELRFSDKIGAEEIYFHAERDFNREVENNDSLKVGYDAKDPGDQTIDIFNNRTITVDQGDESVTLTKGSRTVDIKQDDTLTIQSGDHTIEVNAGASSITAAKSITLKVGGSVMTIDTQGISLKAPQITITGQTKAEIKSPMTTVSGDGILTLKGGLVKIN